MATHAIGDVQGCRRELERLLVRIAFDPAVDRLWFVGDLVNRGPDSAGVLRLVRDLGDAAVSVLGNHDLHFLGRVLGVRRAKRNDTLAPLLRAGDRDDLFDWLRHRPLLHHEHGHVLVHAGLAPEWTVADAAALSREIETVLRGDDPAWLVDGAAGGGAWPRWSDDLGDEARLVTAARYLTRVRCLAADGTPDDDFGGPPGLAPPGLTPWYAFPGTRRRRTTIVHGHWAALGLRLDTHQIAVDTGCVWGRALTAVRLEDRAVEQATAR